MSGAAKAGEKAVAKAGQKLAGKALKQGAAKLNPLEAIKIIAEAAADYAKVAEQESTKRRAIDAQERVALERIRTQREVLTQYLDRSFDERRENFDRLFDNLDEAVDKSDASAVGAMVGAIVRLAESSPFKDIADVAATRAALDDPDTEFEI